MNLKLLGALAAPVLAIAVTAASPPIAQTAPGIACQRSVAIETQVTSAEGDGTLSIIVSSGGCAAAGYVSYAITDGTARRPADFTGGNGSLQFAAGDMTIKTIRVRLTADPTPEAALETFTVTLVNPSPGVTVSQAVAQARIGDSANSWLAGDDRICPMDTPGVAVAPGPSPPPNIALCTYENGNVVFWVRFVNTNPLEARSTPPW